MADDPNLIGPDGLHAMGPATDPDPTGDDRPEPDEARKALVNKWQDRIRRAKSYWEPSFRRMREDQDFAIGLQWSKDRNDKRYTANITLRMVEQKTAFLYAKNPKAIARRRRKIDNQIWDGTQTQLERMQDSVMASAQSPLGMEALQAAMPEAMAIAQEYKRIHDQNQMIDKIAETLELLYDYNINEQSHSFKQMMKMVVRRTVTTGVGYVKLGFQRVMEKRPEVEARIADISERLATVKRLADEYAEGEIHDNTAEAEELKVLLADLQNQVEFVVREGLLFDYPASTAIIPDPKTIQLREFLGADWVAQEYILSPEEVMEIYGVDVKDNYTAYVRPLNGDAAERALAVMRTRHDSHFREERAQACVWEIYSRKDGLVYVVLDGYEDFLREPASPEIFMDRFYPWFALVFNECVHEEEIYPPSDVRLMKDMQLEYNRARQGMREHRIAARPKTVVSAGMLDDEDLRKLENHPANAVLEINGLQPGQDVKTVLQPFMGPGLDPNLYEINPVFEDMMRTTGVQEANMGGLTNGTATESQIAEASRQTSMGANIDDLDDLLTQLARAGGQILMREVSQDTAKRIAGEGAVWPQLSKQDIADDIYLEIEAGSTGRPNQAQEISNLERLAPLLTQIPGLDPDWLLRETIRRLDDKIDPKDVYKPLNPSIVMLNSMKMGELPGGGVDPNKTGGVAGEPNRGGANNAPAMPGQAGDAPPDQVRALAGGLPN